MKPYDKSNVSRGLSVSKLSSDQRRHVQRYPTDFPARLRRAITWSRAARPFDTSDSRAILIRQFLFEFLYLFSSPL